MSVSKQGTEKFDMERFNLKKLKNELVNDQYEIRIWNKFAAF